MTLLMAAPTSEDTIVIAADTREMGDFPELRHRYVVKLKALSLGDPRVVVMWAYAGSLTGGDLVEGLMDDNPPPALSWPTFHGGCAENVCRTNRDLMIQGRPGDRVGVLVAGFVAGQRGIATFNKDGALADSLAFHAIGSVAVPAYDKWGSANGPMTAEQVKHKMIGLFEDVRDDRYESIGGPWDIWEITPQGARPLTDIDRPQ